MADLGQFDGPAISQQPFESGSGTQEDELVPVVVAADGVCKTMVGVCLKPLCVAAGSLRGIAIVLAKAPQPWMAEH